MMRRLGMAGYNGFVECPKVESVCMNNIDGDLSNSSGYKLFSHLTENIMNMLYGFVYSFTRKD
jgi:hypothetical protein